MLRTLVKLAHKLDKEGNTQGASIIDAAIAKLAQEDDFGDLFDPYEEELPGEENPFEGESRYESGGLEADVIPLGADEDLTEKNMFEEILSFVMAIADGAYTDIKEAVADAESLLEELDETEHEDDMGPLDSGLEPELELGEEVPGKVLEFPAPE